jgi:magnesium chelatase family protein
MVGGGVARKVKPGEISLAHNGVLFLDELPEFPKVVIDSLRQPIESGSVLISRVNSHVRYPANFQLIAAMNPCKCGYIEDLDRACKKAPICATDYQSKISGPIMDRFDIHISVPAILNYGASLNAACENSSQMAKRVKAVRQQQQQRLSKYQISSNHKLDGQALIEFATPTTKAKQLLDDAANKFKLSMRAYNRIIRVSRTIADMAQDQVIDKIHIAEALSYRQMDYRLSGRSSFAC